jgi:glyceraldehyde 3-phosphate dehydrogenase
MYAVPQGQLLESRRASVQQSAFMMSGPSRAFSTNSSLLQKAMVARVGINGFGRIGRLVLRSTFMDQADKAAVVAINAPGKDLTYLKYLFEFDSVHGRFPGTVEIGDGGLIINGEFVKVVGERDPANIDWKSINAEYICESTGKFLTEESVKSITKAGKKVIFSAPAKDDSPMFVFGVNHDNYKSSMQVVSAASCTTNCLAPLSKIINDKFGIDEGLMTTVHATTSSNVSVDGASAKDPRGGRANGPNIIPSSTGAAKAVGKVLPELKGKLTGMAFRVPTTNVSVVDLTVKLKKDASWDDICNAVKEAANGPMKGVVEFVDQPLVSQDFVSHPATCCFDSTASIQLSPKFVKLVAWYDNEWAYCN